MFTDIHHHTVYGVDDGADTLEHAMAMLQLASAQGVSRIICTSHASQSGSLRQRDIYLAHLAEEQAILRQMGLELELAPGSEILWNGEVPSLLKAGRLLPLNRTAYVLVEFVPQASYEDLSRAARALGREGYLPIFAHVERYACLRKKGTLEELCYEDGVIAQMNAHTVIEADRVKLFGDRWPLKMLSEGLIQIVASDAHNTTSRKCRLNEAFECLRKRFGRDTAEALCMIHPQMVWNGEEW